MRPAARPPGRAGRGSGGAWVVQLGKYYAPDVGGVETLTRDLAVGFAGAGLRSEVVVFGARTRVAHEDGVVVTRCRAALHLLSQPVGLGWVARAARALSRADAVVLHAPNLLGTLVAIVVRRAPLIAFWHSDVLDKGLARGWPDGSSRPWSRRCSPAPAWSG